MRKLIALIALLAGLASVVTLLLEDPEPWFRDFTFDHASALAFVHGRDPYGPVMDVVPRELPQFSGASDFLSQFPQWHPPLQILAGVPFVGFSYATAFRLWVILSVAAFVAAVFLFAQALKWSHEAALTLAAGALAIPVVRMEFDLGQSQGLVLLLFVLAWRALRMKHGQLRAGILLGLAAALRLWPGFMLFTLIGLKRKTAAKTMVLTAAVFFLAPALLLRVDPSELLDRLGGYGAWRRSPWNISVHAAIPWVSMAALASVVLAILATRRLAATSGDPFWACIPLMLLAVPISWTVYLIVAIPWFALAIWRSSGPRRLIFVLIALVGSVHLPTVFWHTGFLAIIPLTLGAGIALEFFSRPSQALSPASA